MRVKKKPFQTICFRRCAITKLLKLTLLMYLQPQTVLHPHTSVSYFHAHALSVLSGGVFRVVWSVSVISVRFSCVIAGIVLIGGGASVCGDNERIRGKSISIIVGQFRLFTVVKMIKKLFNEINDQIKSGLDAFLVKENDGFSTIGAATI